MKTTFTETSEGFTMWASPPAAVYLKVYLYNITNKDEFMAGKEKLRVQEVGPYVYRERGEHTETVFNDNGTVTAVPKYPLEFIPEMSIGREDDVLVLPNVAVLSFAELIAKENSLTRMAVNFFIARTNSQPIVEQTAHEFMFNFSSPLVTLGNTFIPNWISFDHLGLIDRMYDFDGDISTTYTGQTDLHLSGILDTYNRNPVLPQWEAPCNKLEGSSDGTKFPTGVKANESLRFFRKSMCRSVPMVQASSSLTSFSGIPAVHYKFKDDALDNGESNPDNKCFCYKGRCLPRGLIDVMHCYYELEAIPPKCIPGSCLSCGVCNFFCYNLDGECTGQIKAELEHNVEEEANLLDPNLEASKRVVKKETNWKINLIACPPGRVTYPDYASCVVGCTEGCATLGKAGHCTQPSYCEGFPIALSYPHFYNSDPKLVADVEGSTPSQELHETYFHINPDTGTPTKVSVKMQINVALGDLSSISHCERFSNLVVPLLWTDITMPDLNLALKVKLFLLLRVAPVAETVVLYLLLIGGVAFILLSLIAIVCVSTIKPTPAQTPNQIVKKPVAQPINPNLNKDEYMIESENKIPHANKEMDVYFCSLLTQTSDNDTP